MAQVSKVSEGMLDWIRFALTGETEASSAGTQLAEG